jgi:cytochrome P450
MSALTPYFELASEALSCPYPLYDEARSAAPVYYDEDAGFWVITGHAEVEFVATNPQIFSSINPGGPTVEATAAAVESVLSTDPVRAARVRDLLGDHGAVLFNADPPHHSRHRRLLNKAFTPRTVVQLEPTLVDICNEAIDKFIDRGACDFVSDYADIIPARAQASLLGIPARYNEDMIRWGRTISGFIGGRPSIEEIQQMITDQLDFFEYLDEALEERQNSPTNDLLSRIANARYGDDEPLTNKEIVGLAAQMVGAGTETTTKLLSNAMNLLLNDPGLLKSMREDYSRLPEFFEEALRLESPVQGDFRRATRDCEVGGKTIGKGDDVWIGFAAANRDDSVFACPAAYDAERSNLRAHMAFGRGNHFCIGAPLARLIARVAFETLFTRLDDLRFDTAKQAQLAQTYVLHGFTSLPVTFTAVTREAGAR